MKVATFVVAVVALCASVASLTWQIVVFLLSGVRAAATVRYGVKQAVGSKYMTVPMEQDGTLPVVEDVESQVGPTVPIFLVEVHNTGRQAVSVNTVEFIAATGEQYGLISGGDFGPKLPCRLEVGASEKVGFLAEEIESFVGMIRQKRQADRLVGRFAVELGNGKRVRTKEIVFLAMSDG